MKIYAAIIFGLVLNAGYATATQGDAYSETIVDATQVATWNALTTKAGLESWMVSKAEVDWRIGGLIRTHYQKDGVIGDEGTIENVILSFDAPRMYSVRIVKVPKGFPFTNSYQSVWSVVYLESLGPSKTKVSIRMLGFNDEDESQKMRDFFLRGNQYTIDHLAEKFSH